MSSLQQPGRFLNYGGGGTNQRTQAGAFPQSLSGSETDVSTSNENLSHEERYVIRHTARQEPQGQENLQASNRSSLKESLPSNRSSLDVSSSSYNTLIIHSASEEPWNGRFSGLREHSDVGSGNFLLYSSETKGSSSSNKEHSVRNSLEASNQYDTGGVQEITDIPDDYLNQSQVLKHLAKEVKTRDSGASDRSIEVDKGPSLRHKSSCVADKQSLSRSQPDLSSSGKWTLSCPRPRTKGRENANEPWPGNEMVEILMKENAALKLEIDSCYQKISKTQKLEQEVSKVYRAHEELVQSCERRERLERAARSRLQSDCRRLQEMNRALREQVELLTTQVLTVRAPVSDLAGSDGLRKELNKREVLITQLITQNKELVAAKERQEIELAAQRATLQEQRTHIDILDTALTNAQGNVVRLEEECRKKQMYVERVAQLQRALSSLQLASDRREQTERKLRLQLETELRNERSKGELGGDDDGPEESGAELKRQLREKDEKIMRLEGDCAKWEQRYLEESALRQAAIDAASIPKDAKIAALEKTSQETEKLIAEARNEKIRHMDEVHAAQKRVADLESRLKDLESKLAERDAMIRVLQKHAYDKDVSYPSMLGRSPHHTPHPSLHASPDLDAVLSGSVSREELVSSVLTSSTGFGSGNSYAGSDSSYHVPSYKSFDSTKKTLDDQLKELDSQLDSQLLSKRGLCCFPGFSNPGTATRKGKIPKPLLAAVTGAAGGAGGGTALFLQTLVPSARTESGEMLLLEKQGLSSQQQRMQDQQRAVEAGEVAASLASAAASLASADASAAASRHRSGSLPPSSLPRPPRSHRAKYNRLESPADQSTQRSDSQTRPRKKSDGGDSINSNCSSGGVVASKRPSPSPSRSLIPPRKLGEYGRLSETSLRKPPSSRNSNAASATSGSERNSASTLSDNSASSLPSPTKLRLFPPARRGSSLGRDAKPPTDTTSNKYRIQF